MSDEYVSVEELQAELSAAHPPTVIDVRGHDDYAAGHIPGALPIPGDALSTRLSEIPRHRPVVTY